MLNSILRAAILGAMLLAAAPVDAQTSLAWKFTPGQKLSVELTQRAETESQFGGKPTRVTVDATLEQAWLVDEVATDGTAKITQEFRRIAIKLELPSAGSITYDSASTKKPSAEGKTLAESLGPLIGGKLHIKMAPTGEILEVTLADELAAQLEKLPADAGWKSLFTRDGLSQMLRQSLLVFPKEPVAADATWQRQLDIAAPFGKVRQTSDYRYVGPESRDMRLLERIEVVGKVELSKGTGSATPPTIKQQSQTGQFWFDPQAGRLVESAANQRLQIEAKVRDTTVAVTITSTLKTRFSEK